MDYFVFAMGMCSSGWLIVWILDLSQAHRLFYYTICCFLRILLISLVYLSYCVCNSAVLVSFHLSSIQEQIAVNYCWSRVSVITSTLEMELLLQTLDRNNYLFEYTLKNHSEAKITIIHINFSHLLWLSNMTLL